MAKHKKERVTANKLGLKFNEVMREKNIVGDYAAVAEWFTVAVPSVYGWVDKGRISKDRLPSLVTWSGRPLTWWLDAETDPSNPTLTGALSDWRLQASTRSQKVIDQLSSFAQHHALQDEDWLVLQAMAQRLAGSAQRQADPQDRPLEITAEAQEVIDNRVREAQHRREQNQQQSHRPAKVRIT